MKAEEAVEVDEIEDARERIGAAVDRLENHLHVSLLDILVSVVREAVEVERESCAKIADDYAADRRAAYMKHDPSDEKMRRFIGGQECGADAVAEAIRARGEQQ